jgi:hypothetical protein
MTPAWPILSSVEMLLGLDPYKASTSSCPWRNQWIQPRTLRQRFRPAVIGGIVALASSIRTPSQRSFARFGSRW